MDNLFAVAFYLDGRRISQMTLAGVYTTLESAKEAQIQLCGGKTTPEVNSCVRGTNSVVSWICEIPVGQRIDWTLAVAGPHH